MYILHKCVFLQLNIAVCPDQGMVEKWLLQVEDVMINSLRKVIKDSVEAYKTTPRRKWVLDWPGQVVLCTSNIFWTAGVDAAITDQPDGMKVG